MHSDLYTTYYEFGRKQLRPSALQRDQLAHFDENAWSALHQAGFFGINIPHHEGGSGGSLKDSVLAHKALAEGSLDLGYVFSLMVQSGVAPELFRVFGSEMQKRDFLQPMLRDELRVTVANSEHQTGTDMRKASAFIDTNKDGQPCVTAHKAVCTNAPVADIALISAQNHLTDTFDIYVIDTALGKLKNWSNQLTGVRTGVTGGFFLDAVPMEDIDRRRLGVPGQGTRIMQFCFDLDRLYLAAMVSGCLYGLADLAMQNIQQRAQKNPSFAQHQYVQEKYFRVFSCAEKVDALLMRLLEQLPDQLSPDSFKPHRDALAVLKELICNEAYEAAFGIFELSGFPGFKTDHLIQKVLRDLMAFQFLGGTKELQKNMVFQNRLRLLEQSLLKAS